MSTEAFEQSTDPLSEECMLALSHLTTGSTLLKAGRSGRPHYRRFNISPDLKKINWESPRKDETGACVFIKDIKELIKGQETAVFKASPLPQYESISFSLIYSNGERSLDVICTDKNEFDAWMTGLDVLMKGFQDWKALERFQQISQERSKSKSIRKAGVLEVEFGALLGTARVTRQEDSCDVYMWGRGVRGLLGHGEETNESEPRLLEALLAKDITMLAMSTCFSMALSSGGEVFSWGSGKYGRLGHGNLRDRFMPLMIGFPLRGTDVIYVACSETHAAIVLDSGELFTWGRAGSRLGYACEEGRQTYPRPVEALGRRKVKATMVACGKSHTLVLSETGQLYSFGDNDFGQLGAGLNPGDEPKIEREDDVAICQVKTTHIAVNITSGAYHSALITDKGQAVIWGRGDGGQLGNGDTQHSGTPQLISAFTASDPVRDIACGDSHTAALTESGKLYYWGVKIGLSSTSPLIGDLEYPDILEQHQVSPNRVENSAPNLVPTGLAIGTIFRQISSGSNFVAVLTTTGRVLTWGQNSCGQLGHKDMVPRSKPAVIEALYDKSVEALFCGGYHMGCTVKHSWVPDKDANLCMLCNAGFTMTRRRHHCRKCGGIFCGNCSSKKFPLLDLGFSNPVRVCDRCHKRLNEQLVQS